MSEPAISYVPKWSCTARTLQTPSTRNESEQCQWADYHRRRCSLRRNWMGGSWCKCLLWLANWNDQWLTWNFFYLPSFCYWIELDWMEMSCSHRDSESWKRLEPVPLKWKRLWNGGKFVYNNETCVQDIPAKSSEFFVFQWIVIGLIVQQIGERNGQRFVRYYL